jgi:dihydrofolate synthase / folylpolyglutamate synthase
MMAGADKSGTADASLRLARKLEQYRHIYAREKVELGLERTQEILSALNHPEQKLPPIIHVAGTNGKGSTCAFLRAFLEAAGYRVHVFTSPHLVHYNERIRVAGKLLDDAALLALLEEIEATNGDRLMTYFEVTFAAACLAFSRTPADVVILEVGMGGRLDATNVIGPKAAAIVTRLSYDHVMHLGNDMTSIAREKAGILRGQTPAIFAPQPDAAAASCLLSEALRVGATPCRGGVDWASSCLPDGRLHYKDSTTDMTLPAPALPGPHQYENAGTAIACLLKLPHFQVSEDAFAKGLRQVDWPGRLQQLTTGPLPRLLPQGWDLWLDGGHNDSGAEVLAKHIRQNWAGDGKPIWLIYGMLSTKQPEVFLGQLAPLIAGICTIAIPGEAHSLTAAETAAAADHIGIARAIPCSDVAAAINQIVSINGQDGRILICGSLYLVGHVLAEYGETPTTRLTNEGI